jgi:hypothetical protein
VVAAFIEARTPMVSWPKSILTLGANLLTARTAIRLKADRSRAQQRRTFGSLVRKLAGVRYWHQAGIEAGMTYEAFRAGVPIQPYTALQPLIARMQGGEGGVLWPGDCMFFATTGGTSTGSPKTLPVTPDMLAHFRRGCRDALLYYTARVGHAGVFRGRQLFVTGSTGLTPGGTTGRRTFIGEWPAIAALNLAGWAESHLYEPGMEIGLMTDWQQKLDAMVARTAGLDISLIAGMPTWVLSFAEAMRLRGSDSARAGEPLQAIWRNLEVYVHGGVSVAPYLTELREALGADVNFHEVYAGAEGFFAAQDTPANGELRVLADSGIFFEFVPFADFDPERHDASRMKAVTLADVTIGVDYAVLLSTPGGLARYVVEDIVRFTSTKPPRLTYVGRTSLLLSAFGERVLERDVTQTLVNLCQRHRWSIVNFHVAPLFEVALTGQPRGRHEWWIELKPGTVETPTGPQMAMELDADLQRTSATYRERRAGGRIDAPTVRLVMPGVFRHWMRFHGKWGGQNQVARCRSDRRIADELAQITKFARDQG